MIKIYLFPIYIFYMNKILLYIIWEKSAVFYIDKQWKSVGIFPPERDRISKMLIELRIYLYLFAERKWSVIKVRLVSQAGIKLGSFLRFSFITRKPGEGCFVN